MGTPLCCLPKVIYNQPPAAVPPGHCAPNNLVGRAGTHVKKTYILLQKQIAKNLLMDCHVASKPLINAKHSGPVCWAVSTSWPAYSKKKPITNTQKTLKMSPNLQHERQTHCVKSRQHDSVEQKCGLWKTSSQV